MTLDELCTDPRLQRILTHPDDDNAIWRGDLERFLCGDVTLTRKSAGEAAVKTVQRLLIFLGYSTSASGAFQVDGDFGRGTNRGIAQFQFEHALTRTITRAQLCYPCKWNTAARLITAVPDSKLTVATVECMASVALARSASGEVMCGSLDDAIFHLNALHKRRFLDSRAILARYGSEAVAACQTLEAEEGFVLQPEWLLAIIRQETAGVIRPRFEQHYLSRLNEGDGEAPLAEMRMRSMSLGLGQIMGENHHAVGAANATVLFTAPVTEQLAFIARFLRPRKDIVRKVNPTESDFRSVARFYNGPGYEAHQYHESLARWCREFRQLIDIEGCPAPPAPQPPPASMPAAVMADAAPRPRYSLTSKPADLSWFRKTTRVQMTKVSEPFEVETQEGVLLIAPDTVDGWDDGYFVAYPDDGTKPYAIAPAYVRVNYAPSG
jgi:peptidoglycan hydrolase-like protein with peptidoglycan-binding domain